MHNIIIVCGSCDQPANLHPVLPDSGEFVIPCPREANEIGFSTWNDTSAAYFATRTEFKQDVEVLEALGLINLNLDSAKKVAIPKGSHDTEVSDYCIIDGITTLSMDHSGTPAQSGSDLIMHRIADDYGIFGIGADEAPYIQQDSPASEQSKLDRWNDATHVISGKTETWVSTSILGEPEGEYLLTKYENGQRSKIPLDSSETIDKTQRNAYVEGNEGFISLSLLDEQLTRKYHAKLLNVFLDKQTGDVRVGSIRLIKNVDGSLTARCVNRDCGPNGKRASMTIYPDSPDCTRTQMEDFVWAMVSHGNNHAAAWFKSRETYHKVHRLGCDINVCDPQAVNCSTLSPHVESLNEVEFLMEHQRYCKSKTCKCDARLEELVGSMDVNAHVYASAS